MTGLSDTGTVEFQGWTLRTREAAAGPGRRMLLIHGWTGDENSMWVFARHLPPDYWIVAPRAPYATTPSGFSWREEGARPGARPNLDDLSESVENVIALLDSLTAAHGLPGSTWNVMGFSQGAAMAAALALRFPARVERIALLAGFIPAGGEKLAALVPLRGKTIFMAHGRLDELVDIELGRDAARVLESAGAHVELCEEQVGHKVGADCMRRLTSFFL